MTFQFLFNFWLQVMTLPMIKFFLQIRPFSFYLSGYKYFFIFFFCFSYNQNFDLEGESGIVVHGIGTAVTLVRHLTLPSVNINIQPAIDE